MFYKVHFEKSKTGYSAYVPALPGCIATSSTKRSTREMISKAIAFHLKSIKNQKNTF